MSIFVRMELFYTNSITQNGEALLNEKESRHCIKVLRHKRGDLINFVDGVGGLYTAEILSDREREVRLRIVECNPEYERRGYYLHMAVAPTKNIDRYEWFIEKAVELGVDEITPIIGEHSERKVFKRDRGERIILSAMKQSLKAKLPKLNDAIPVSLFLSEVASAMVSPIEAVSTDPAAGAELPAPAVARPMKLIGHCRDGERRPFVEALSEIKVPNSHIIMMIGPEGDFSTAEIECALNSGFTAVKMGDSRMRVETAALTAVSGVYLILTTA